jgi:hypothetical protein
MIVIHIGGQRNIIVVIFLLAWKVLKVFISSQEIFVFFTVVITTYCTRTNKIYYCFGKIEWIKIVEQPKGSESCRILLSLYCTN